MLKVETNEVMGMYSAMRGMRNPLNSWANGDTKRTEELMCDFSEPDDAALVDAIPTKHSSCCFEDNEAHTIIGDKDMQLACNLIKAGPSHRKFLRQIFVSANITAPFYWWKEFDTYKVGTTANSCSTMHTLTNDEITSDMFSFDHITSAEKGLITLLESIRKDYLEETEPLVKKALWRELIQLLPMSFNQKRTVTFSYENLISIYEQRKGHKLEEWKTFRDWIENLPYMVVWLHAANDGCASVQRR